MCKATVNSSYRNIILLRPLFHLFPRPSPVVWQQRAEASLQHIVQYDQQYSSDSRYLKSLIKTQIVFYLLVIEPCCQKTVYAYPGLLGSSVGNGTPRLKFNMESLVPLGSCLLKTTGVNYLEQALSTDGNLLWYDGQVLWLSDLKSQFFRSRGNSNFAIETKSRPCGQLSNVLAMSWSSCGHLMAIVSQSQLSVRRMTENCQTLNKLMEENNLIKANRCIWHQSKPIVSFLSDEGLWFYEVKSEMCVPIFQWQPLTLDCVFGCMCWIADYEMILSSKHSIHKLSLPPTAEAMGNNEATGHLVISLKSQIQSILSISADLVAVATDLQLNLTTVIEAQDLFEVPCQKQADGGRQEIDTQPSHGHLSALLHLKRQTPSDSAALLHVVSLSHSSSTPLCSSPMAGIITPDLLCYNQEAKHVLAGSNTFRILYVFLLHHTAHGTHLEQVRKIELGLLERPKGLCWGQTLGTFVLVGKLNEDPQCTFLPSSVVMEYKLTIGHLEAEPNGSIDSQCKQPAVEAVSSDEGSLCELTDLMLPNGHFVSGKQVLVQDIGADSSPGGVPDSDLPSDRQLLSAALDELRCIRHLLASQANKMTQIESRLQRLETKDCNKLPHVSQLPVLYVTVGSCGPSQHRAFLLTRKQLHLAVLQKVFGMEQIAMVVEGMPNVVLTADRDGLIPIEFEPGSMITIVEIAVE